MAADPEALVTSMPNPALVVNDDGVIVAANDDAATLAGGPIVGLEVDQLVPDRARQRHVRLRSAFALAPDTRAMGLGRELIVRKLDGTEVPTEIALSRIETESGGMTLVLLVDIRERMARMAALEVRARTDALTGLANRATADDELARRMRARAPFCVMAVDVDGLRDANTRFGHPGGDAILKAFARRLRSVVREEDLVARMGGDEFVVIAGLTMDDAVRVASRMTGAGAEPVEVGGERVALTGSVGIAERRSGDSRASIVARADIALFAAKAAGRCAVAVIRDGNGSPVVVSQGASTLPADDAGRDAPAGRDPSS